MDMDTKRKAFKLCEELKRIGTVADRLGFSDVPTDCLMICRNILGAVVNSDINDLYNKVIGGK